MDSEGAFLSGAAIRWRARRGVKQHLEQIRDMQSESFASQCCIVVEGQSDMDEIGDEMREEDIVMSSVSCGQDRGGHFDQQSFRRDLSEEESDSDDADETDQPYNLGESLRTVAGL